MARRNPGNAAWLSAPLARLTGRLLLSPRTVLAVAIGLAIASLLFASLLLGFHSSRLDLLDPNSAYNQRWLAYLDEFGREDDVVIVVEGSGAGDVVPVIDDIVDALAIDDGSFEAVLYQRDLSHLRSKALHFLSISQLQRIETLVQESEAILGRWNSLSAASVLQTASHSLASHEYQVDGSESAQVAWLRDYMSGLEKSLAGEEEITTPWSDTFSMVRDLSRQFGSEYLLNEDGRLGMVLLRLRRDSTGMNDLNRLVGRLRGLLAAVQERHPDTHVGLTGMPILESDEMSVSQHDTARASVVSLAGVACVFIVGFGGFRRPMLALSVLIIGLAWSLAYATLSVGHLNILSASFGVILIGLGVDFSIHYLTRYASFREHSDDRATVLMDTARAVGPGIVTGGITTALAFSTASLTEFTGIAELGVIVAGGIILCLVAAIMVLPVLVLLWDAPHRQWTQPVKLADRLRPFERRPFAVLVLAITVSALLGSGLTYLRYDHNLLNLQPANLESVVLEQTLAARLNRGVWFALSVAETREQLLDRKASFEKLPTVAGTEEIVSLLPETTTAQHDLIARIARRLHSLPREVPLIPVGAREELLQQMSQLGRSLFRNAEYQATEYQGNGDDKYAMLGSLEPALFYERLSQYQQQVADDLLRSMRIIRVMANPESPGLMDVPSALRTRFVGQHGHYLLRVYGHKEIWDMEPLEQFVRSVEAVDPAITGHPVQTYYASRQMQRSFLNAALYALLAVSAVLILDFRRIGLCVFAMVPMAIGLLLLLGSLGWLGIPLNPANMIVLPLIMGIGIDDGVHVVHDYLRQLGHSYRLSNATANAVFLTSITTMIGFGSMMLASHRGLRSLGQVLTIGIFCCLVTSIFVLPPLLRWFGTVFSSQE
jgi:hopanoid biosynthesis associated RND transporter like protein HpnN